MKISKLFHWLYGLVMLLPIFAILVTCGYVVLNPNAKDSYTGSYQYLTTTKYDTYITNKQIPITSYTDGQYTNYTISSTSFNNIDTLIPLMSGGIVTTGFYGFNVNSIIFNNVEYTNIKSVVYGFVTYNRFSLCTFDVPLDSNTYIIVEGNLPYIYLNDVRMTPLYSFTNYYTFAPFEITANLNNNIIYSNTNVNNSGVLSNSTFDLYMNDTTLSSVFYSSVNNILQAPLFSWASDSFLVAPFSFIANLFSMPTDSPVVMLLSYWLAISIIWLVFDLIMYIPLLVHRWLDKGIIE